MIVTNVPYLISQDFISKGYGIVSFGTAPDGLPFLTSICFYLYINRYFTAACGMAIAERSSQNLPCFWQFCYC